MWRRALILLSFCGLISLAWAQEVRMVPTGVFVGIGTPKVVTPGQTTSFEVRMQLLPPFHAYARGQEGAPEMRFDFPEGVEVLGVDWPKPEKISALGEVFDGYSEQVRWRVRVHISDKMGKGDFPVGVRLNAVICSDTQCFPVEFTESTVLEVGSVASGGINWSGWTEEKETDLLGKMGASGAPGMWGMLLLAFIGGVILNLMPCVFPVLGIKIMSFVRNSGQSRARTVALGGAYAVGILASMWALTGIFISCAVRVKQSAGASSCKIRP
jgi:thiol:disulfide interchange protein DsbD